MTSAANVRAFVAELAAAGVTDAVVCPGSRSTPLALALRANPAVRVRVLLDERSAGFFALGLAKVTRRAVAICVTSGTAAANLLPAAVEATLARVPLILLTADRPAELRDRGAPQAIDQVGLFGSHAKWFAELPVPDGSPTAEAHLRACAARAVATALAGPAGPVHLNAPFREPLIPDGDLANSPTTTAGAAPTTPPGATPTTTPGASPRPTPMTPFAPVLAGPRRIAIDGLASLAERLASTPRGLIVAGPQDDPALPAALVRLAAVTGYPILADPLSGLRTGAHDRSRVLARGDFLLRAGAWRDAHAPSLVLRFGAMPTSKPFLQALEARPSELYVVDGDGGWREPALLPATFVHADPSWLASALADALAAPTPGAAPAGSAQPPPASTPQPAQPQPRPAAGLSSSLEVTQPRPPAPMQPVASSMRGNASTSAPSAPSLSPDPSVAPVPVAAWADEWLAADRAVDHALRRWLAGVEASREAFEGAPFTYLGDLLPAGAILWAGSSMPVRDMDSWLPSVARPIRVLANRGANGIDGVISSALGAAAAGAGHVTLVIGDVSFLHDIGGLLAAKLQHLALTIVLVHNDGGGIFSFLPQGSAQAPGAGLPAHYEELFGTPHGVDVAPIVEGFGGSHRRVEPSELKAALASAAHARGVTVLELRTDRARNLALHRDAAEVAARALAMLLRPAR